MSSGGVSNMLAAGERGARRKKLAGYLKAANELRQSYTQSYGATRQGDGEYDDEQMAGAFPDVAIARHGDEEMVLFPSYARRHVKKEPRQNPASLEVPPNQDNNGAGEAEYWRREWEKHEDDNAIVDVDVRGWMYTPHRGPMNRKNRILMGIARHLSGIPAPNGSTPRQTSPSGLHDRKSAHEEELVLREAELIKQRGIKEADVAGRGGYSENPAQEADRASIRTISSYGDSRSPSPLSGDPRPEQLHHPLTNSSLTSDDDPKQGFLAKRSSWNQPADMTPDEIAVANAHLMARLRPFLSNPLISSPLTLFFYNDKTSQSRTTTTDDAGHFNFRAALDFVPTKVRVLASPKLSAVEEVRITEPHGVSVISDIDDTIKHSSISSGAKEIFRNTFIRNLEDLTIEGVREWYCKMSEMGAQMHYVSNSPWQLYPVLVTFFAASGLPQGSYHLKQYTGMLQGIFEPVAERKKGTLDRILRDFPDRRFILIGDSGEADLELYTDVVLGNPGRILGVFIRDVTTTSSRRNIFEGPRRSSASPYGNRISEHNSIQESPKPKGTVPDRPALPPRRPTIAAIPETTKTSHHEEDLIDLSEPGPISHSQSTTALQGLSLDEPMNNIAKSLGPKPPAKPAALRSPSNESQMGSVTPPTPSDTTTRKGPPPPPKPRKISRSRPTDSSPLAQSQLASPPSNNQPSTYRAAVSQKVAAAYNYLPAAPSYFHGTASRDNASASTRPSNDRQTMESQGNLYQPRSQSTSRFSNSAGPPPVPPRRSLTSYPTAAANYATNRLGLSASGDNSENEGGFSNGTPPTTAQNKKEELWVRRWMRAKEILERNGVMLRSWRAGNDVMKVAVDLIDKENRRLQLEPNRGK
ncbi:hypothetical protein MMC25_003563 [Agyrium rufum]|nr:hypothetical protein [Agyrium rufum]